jgi:hypothetical protein
VRPELVDYMVGMRELRKLQDLGLVQGRPNQDMITALGRAVLDARGPVSEDDPAPSPEQRAFLIRYRATPGGLVERTPEQQAKYRAKLDRWYGPMGQDHRGLSASDDQPDDQPGRSPWSEEVQHPTASRKVDQDREQRPTMYPLGRPDIPDIVDSNGQHPGLPT